MGKKPSSYIEKRQYRIPVQEREPRADGTNFSVNRQITPPDVSHLFSGQGALRTRRGDVAAGAGPDDQYNSTSGSTHWAFHSYGPRYGTGNYRYPGIGLSIMTPLWLETSHTYDRLMMRCSSAFDGTFTTSLFYLNEDTFLPSSYVGTGGIHIFTGIGGNSQGSISWTPTQNLCGICLTCSIINSGNPNAVMKMVGAPNCDDWPVGYRDDGVQPLAQMNPYRIQATADVTNMANWSKVEVTGTWRYYQCQPLIAMRRSA